MGNAATEAVLALLGEDHSPPRAALAVAYRRDLTPADLTVVGGVSLGVSTPSIKKIRHIHHSLARLLAEGRKPVECSAITGYSQSRISILQRDPAFSELVEYYKTQVEAQYTDIHAKLAVLGTMAIEELQDRLEGDGEEGPPLSNKELMALAELTLDRSVAPPKAGAGRAGQGPAVSGGGPLITIQFVQPAEQVPLTIDVERQ